MEGARTCGRCGATIFAASGPCPACGDPGPMLPALPYPGNESPESRDLYRTRLGLLLLAVGVVASLLPVGSLVGDVLVLIGGLFLIQASRPFGQAHTRNAKVGLVLAFAGGLAAYYVTVAFPLALATPPSSVAQLPSWIRSVEAAFSVAVLLVILFVGVGNLGLLLITYSLQDRVGRLCLWSALGLGVGLGLALYVFVTQEFDLLLTQVAAGQPPNAAILDAIASQLNLYSYLEVIPPTLFTGCYFLADVRIRRGTIPVRAPAAADTPMN